MSNPYAPEGQDSWNKGNDQGAYPGSAQPYDPNGTPYPQGQDNGYVDQTQQFQPGYGDQGGFGADQTQQFQPGYGDQGGFGADQTQQFQPGYGDQGGFGADQTQQFQPGYGDQGGFGADQTQQFQPGYGDQGGYADQTQQYAAGYADPYTQYGSDTPSPDDKKGSKLPIIVAAVAGVLVLVLIVVGAVIFINRDSEPEPDPTTTSAAPTSSPTPTSTSSPTPTPTSSPTPSPSPSSSGAPTGNPGTYHANGKYSVDFKDGVHLEITKIEKGPADEDGSNTLLVTYSMTNNSNVDQSSTLHNAQLSQKGIDMSNAYFARGKEPAGYDVWASISVTAKPGETKTFMKAYKLPYDNEQVTFETIDFDDFRAKIPDWTWQP